jgi:uncharacterized membrane protein
MAVYNSFKKKIMDGSIDLDTDNINVSLHTSAYTANIDTHTFYSDCTASEVANGNGYTTKGTTLASPVVTIDTTNDLAYFDAADLTWASSTITARYALIWKNTGTNTTSPLVAYVDFGADKTSDNGNFIISWSSAGILKLT